LAAQFFQRYSGFRFFQDVHDLALAELRLLHVDHSLLYCARSFPLFNGTILGEGYHESKILLQKLARSKRRSRSIW
jgi:hypothetical protein